MSSSQLSPKDLPLLHQTQKNQLDELAKWFITNGLSDYYTNRDREVFKREAESRGYALYSTIAIDHSVFIAFFMPCSPLLITDVKCYRRTQADAEILEYWVIQQWSQDNRVQYKSCRFLIAKANNLQDQREILKESDTFFPEFKLDNGSRITFPQDDQSLYFLKAWTFADAFQGSELATFRVVTNGPGDYRRIPVAR